MANLRIIKSKIRSVGKTHQVTKAMEAVSGVKMRTSQMMALSARPYARAALRVLARVSNSLDISQHPLVFKREVSKVLVVVITSDKGLAGGLNSGVTKRALSALRERGIPVERTGIIALGRKGEEFFARRGYIIEDRITTAKNESTINDFQSIVSMVTDLFEHGEYDECLLVYTNFHSTFEQAPVVRTLLPLSVENVREMIEGITPERGKFAEGGVSHGEFERPLDYLFEPSAGAIFETLIYRLVGIEIYHAFLESKASEHSARMVAMRNASDKASEVSFLLTREYNKARQSAITREMSEIIGGMESMK
jgi:F-type H+-transporting ATPase subunit gamma